MAKIKDIYSKYFQKSRSFLYPALNIRRDSSIVPIQSYLAWDDKISSDQIICITDKKLILHYKLRSDQQFSRFEDQKLLNNVLFSDFIQLDSENGLYLFDFSEDYSDDWDHFLMGKYSQFSSKLKKQIANYFRKNKNSYVFMESFMHPEKYYGDYAEVLSVDPNDKPEMELRLKVVGELCEKPDFKKETLKMHCNSKTI
jgi:hypothetical protein